MPRNAAEPKSPDTSPETRVLKALPRSRARLQEYAHNVWQVVAPDDIRPDEMERPELWSIVGIDWVRFDRIEIIQAHRVTEAIVLLSQPGRVELSVLWSAPLREIDQLDQEVRVPAGYEIRHAGPGEEPEWQAVRASDGVIVNAGQHHTKREHALRYLLDHAILRGGPTPRVHAAVEAAKS
jgi:hypothetical protein